MCAWYLGWGRHVCLCSSCAKVTSSTWSGSEKHHIGSLSLGLNNLALQANSSKGWGQGLIHANIFHPSIYYNYIVYIYIYTYIYIYIILYNYVYIYIKYKNTDLHLHNIRLYTTYIHIFLHTHIYHFLGERFSGCGHLPQVLPVSSLPRPRCFLVTPSATEWQLPLIKAIDRHLYICIVYT